MEFRSKFILLAEGHIVMKDLTRLMFPWNDIQAKCDSVFNNQKLCELVSNNSAPNFVEAFVFYNLVSVLLERFGWTNPMLRATTSLVGTALISLAAETIQASTRNGVIDTPDLIMETAGATLAFALALLWTRRDLNP